MDWRTVRFDWNQARAFLVTAEEGTFSAAARALAMTQPTVGRQVAALEDELGVALFARIGNRLELTPTGLDLVEHVRAMGQAATRVSLTATGQSQAVDGPVSVTASEAIAAYMLPPIVAGLRRDWPGIQLELVASNQPSDLQRREADIAVRNFSEGPPDLIAKKVRDTFARFYGAPAYLDRLGPLTVANGFAGAELFGFDRGPLMIEGLRAIGLDLTPDRFPIVCSNHGVQWELCKRGLGLCMMMEEVGDTEPSVRRVVPDGAAIPIPIWLVCHRELRTSRRIRLVFDRLAEALSQPLRPAAS